jgi:hypothetical protein
MLERSTTAIGELKGDSIRGDSFESTGQRYFSLAQAESARDCELVAYSKGQMLNLS